MYNVFRTTPVFPHHSDQFSQRSHVSWVALSNVKIEWSLTHCMSKSKGYSLTSLHSLTQWVTRSPIELFWTAKKGVTTSYLIHKNIAHKVGHKIDKISRISTAETNICYEVWLTLWVEGVKNDVSRWKRKSTCHILAQPHYSINLHRWYPWYPLMAPYRLWHYGATSHCKHWPLSSCLGQF